MDRASISIIAPGAGSRHTMWGAFDAPSPTCGAFAKPPYDPRTGCSTLSIYATGHRSTHDEAVTSRRMADDQTSTGQRYTVHEAALLLGLSVDAVRKRAERGSLKREKDPTDSTVYILLDTDHPASGQETSQHADVGETPTSQLVDSLQDQVDYLRRELDIRNEELRRKDHLLAAALERIPALEEAPSEPRDGPETASDLRPGVDHPQGDDAGPEAGVSRPSGWWRRIFGA